MTIALTKVAYTTAATAKGGRAGHVRSADGVIDLDLAQPGTRGRAEGQPGDAVRGRLRGLLPGCAGQPGQDEGRRHVGVDGDGGGVVRPVRGRRVRPRGRAQGARPGRRAGQVGASSIELAHEFCPYSKATRGNIAVTLTVV